MEKHLENWQGGISSPVSSTPLGIPTLAKKEAAAPAVCILSDIGHNSIRPKDETTPYVVVYDNLLSGLTQSALMEKATLVQKDHIYGAMFITKSNFPVVSPWGKNEVPCEVYEMPETFALDAATPRPFLQKLDGHYGVNSEIFTRQLVTTKSGIVAWAYVWKSNFSGCMFIRKGWKEFLTDG